MGRVSWISLCCQQRFDDVRVPVATGNMQRCVATNARATVHNGACVNQHPGKLGIAMFGGPVQRRHAVAVSLVDIDASTQQVPDCRHITVLGRIRDRTRGRTVPPQEWY